MKQTKLMVMAMMAVALMATSCASKKDLQNCQNENKELSSNYQATKEKLAATEASLAAAQEQLATAKSDYAKLQNSLDKSLNNASQNNVSIEKLVDQINESNQYIRHLVEVKSKSDSLNMVLTNNLTRSLSKEEMKEVDVQVLKGVVYISLADNMLYQSGSYEVNSRAQETLSKIAKIITDYKDYDVLVEGNTDNVPVSTTSAKMKNSHITSLLYKEICNQLKQSDMTMGEIADYLHFNDQSALTNFFKTRAGMTPLAYRNQYN